MRTVASKSVWIPGKKRSKNVLGGHGPTAPDVNDSNKKVSTEEWEAALEGGSLRRALAAINPDKPQGPLMLFCDAERFLHAKKICTA